MNSKYLLVTSSIITGLLGVATSFFSNEIITVIGLAATELPTLFLQLTGSLYLGFSIMNWMAKGVLMGGIYARPLCMGNFMHFVVGAFALVKAAANNPGSNYVWIVAIIYSLFAVLFGIVLFSNTLKSK